MNQLQKPKECIVLEPCVGMFCFGSEVRAKEMDLMYKKYLMVILLFQNKIQFYSLIKQNNKIQKN